MPDITIPTAVVVSLGVIASAFMAVHTGEWRYCAFAGVVGTLFNLVCFYLRIAMTARLLKRIQALRAEAPPR